MHLQTLKYNEIEFKCIVMNPNNKFYLVGIRFVFDIINYT